MAEENSVSDKKTRALYLVGGAVAGAAAGFFLKNVILGSATGIAVGVLLAGRKESR
jgi:hypothetical protein